MNARRIAWVGCFAFALGCGPNVSESGGGNADGAESGQAGSSSTGMDVTTEPDPTCVTGTCGGEDTSTFGPCETDCDFVRCEGDIDCQAGEMCEYGLCEPIPLLPPCERTPALAPVEPLQIPGSGPITSLSFVQNDVDGGEVLVVGTEFGAFEWFGGDLIAVEGVDQRIDAAASGDFDGDGSFDLAMAAPGAVHVAFGDGSLLELPVSEGVSALGVLRPADAAAILTYTDDAFDLWTVSVGPDALSRGELVVSGVRAVDPLWANEDYGLVLELEGSQSAFLSTQLVLTPVGPVGPTWQSGTRGVATPGSGPEVPAAAVWSKADGERTWLAWRSGDGPLLEQFSYQGAAALDGMMGVFESLPWEWLSFTATELVVVPLGLDLCVSRIPLDIEVSDAAVGRVSGQRDVIAIATPEGGLGIWQLSN